MCRLVYSYRRFSDPSQKRGDSISRQTQQAERWVASHPGYELDTSLTLLDAGKSGFHAEHLKNGGALALFLDLQGKWDDSWHKQADFPESLKNYKPQQ